MGERSCIDLLITGSPHHKLGFIVRPASYMDDLLKALRPCRVSASFDLPPEKLNEILMLALEEDFPVATAQPLEHLYVYALHYDQKARAKDVFEKICGDHEGEMQR